MLISNFTRNGRSGSRIARRRPRRRRRPTFRAAIEALEPRTVLSATLVADIAATPLSSNLSNAVDVNGTMYFAADDGVHGVITSYSIHYTKLYEPLF